MSYQKPEPGVPLRRADKVSRIPIKVIPKDEPLKKPAWLKVRLPSASQAAKVRDMLRGNQLFTVCEEASCPNLPECFGHGTATFMILGQVCTRRCPFCDVGHGRPLPVDEQEPAHLADAIRNMRLNYVVITSVDRDDLRDGGARHFADCVRAAREAKPGIKV
ncbi:MAG TPA: lipoyl synthase, partial [Thiolinea sp.]|nr:lipoyl synthase [Thiolinea sp.]